MSETRWKARGDVVDGPGTLIAVEYCDLPIGDEGLAERIAACLNEPERIVVCAFCRQPYEPHGEAWRPDCQHGDYGFIYQVKEQP